MIHSDDSCLRQHKDCNTCCSDLVTIEIYNLCLQCTYLHACNVDALTHQDAHVLASVTVCCLMPEGLLLCSVVLRYRHYAAVTAAYRTK
jgi:hypothetical protein